MTEMLCLIDIYRRENNYCNQYVKHFFIIKMNLFMFILNILIIRYYVCKNNVVIQIVNHIIINNNITVSILRIRINSISVLFIDTSIRTILIS